MCSLRVNRSIFWICTIPSNLPCEMPVLSLVSIEPDLCLYKLLMRSVLSSINIGDGLAQFAIYCSFTQISPLITSNKPQHFIVKLDGTNYVHWLHLTQNHLKGLNIVEKYHDSWWSWAAQYIISLVWRIWSWSWQNQLRYTLDPTSGNRLQS